MTRLPNDCFSSVDDMMSVEAARNLITQNTHPITTVERVDLKDASGRILAEDMFAPSNVPPADNSAVDGYAFYHADYSEDQQKKFLVAGRSAAGAPFSRDLTQGQCVKIFTGAPLPPRSDTVAMIEDIELLKDEILLPQGLKKGANRRKAGEDLQIGNLVLSKGTRIRPQEIAHLACIGKKQIPVFCQIKIGLLSTGNELENPGESLPYGSIYDCNRFMLAALLKKYGCTVQDYGIVRDNFDDIRDTLAEAAASNDLVITSGGVSMGDEDHVKQAVEANGNLHFWRIAIKPGRPLALGQINGTAFVGLPGNPVAALVCALQFVRPLIASLNGESAFRLPLPVFGTADFSMKKKVGRREWLRGRYRIDKNGNSKIEKYDSEGSGLISSLVWSDGLIELDEALSGINKGDTLRFFSYSELFE